MCMIIDKRVKVTETEDGYLVAYKNVNQHGMSPFQYSHTFVVGENQSSRSCAELTKREDKGEWVIEGFHLFVNKDDAIKSAVRWHDKTIKVYFKPEDVVATGVWEDNTSCQNVVVTKLIVKSLEKVKGEQPCALK